MWASMYAHESLHTVQTLYERTANNIIELRELFSWDKLRHAQNYNNEDLAWMLFVDGCSMLQILDKANLSKPEDLKVKIDTLVIIERDLFLIENQLPYELLKLLSEDEIMLKINMQVFCKARDMFTASEPTESLPLLFREILKNITPPTHLLDCLRTSILSSGTESTEKNKPELRTGRGKQSSPPPPKVSYKRQKALSRWNMVSELTLYRSWPQKFDTNLVRDKSIIEIEPASFSTRKPEHVIERGKGSSSSILEHDIERGKQSSPPPPILKSETEREEDPFATTKVNYRRQKARSHWRMVSALMLDRRFRVFLEKNERINALHMFKAENLLDVVHTRNENQKHTSYRNIQELKAAAIRVKRQKNISLKNISFSSSFFGGKLYLPPLILNDLTVPALFNLAAYELCPDFINKFEISSYIKLLDLLIDYPEDVKELRSSGILHNSLGCDEEVVELFNTISSNLVHNPVLYSGLRDEVEKHYKNKLSIWMADAYYTYFKSPWTIIAVLAAVLALVLTALQTWQGFKDDSKSSP